MHYATLTLSIQKILAPMMLTNLAAKAAYFWTISLSYSQNYGL